MSARLAVRRGRTLEEHLFRTADRLAHAPGEDVPRMPEGQDLMVNSRQLHLRGQRGVRRLISQRDSSMPSQRVGTAPLRVSIYRP